MAKLHQSVTRLWIDVSVVSLLLGAHLWYLLHTSFVDWPEMLLYPWLLTKGLLYYRDVVLAYVPGAYYLLHILYSLIGYSVVSERIIAYGFILLTDILVYIVVCKLTKSWISASLALAFFVWWQPILSGNTIWYETMLAPIYLGIYLLALRYIEKPDARRVAPLALLTAGATLIKQTAVWSVLALCMFVWLSHTKKKDGCMHAVGIGLCTIAAHLLVWGYFALHGAGSAYGFWVFGFLFSLSQANSGYALMPPRSDLALILPALLPLGMYIGVKWDKKIWLRMLLFIALVLAGLPRWGLHRFQPALAFVSISVGVLVHYVITAKRWRVLAVGVMMAFFVCIGSWRSMRVFLSLRDSMQPQFFGKTYEGLLTYVKKEVPGPIYILGNYDYLYYGLNEKPTVMPWVPLFPWNAEVPGMQTQIIDSLETNAVPYILYIPYHADRGYYLDYSPEELFLYVRAKYVKIGAAPIPGGELLKRR